MSARQETQFTLSDLRGAFRRHRRKAIIVFCSAVGLAILGLYVVDPTYESEARLFVHVGRETVTLDPTGYFATKSWEACLPFTCPMVGRLST